MEEGQEITQISTEEKEEEVVVEEISEKEKERRRKISEAKKKWIKEKRERGYRAWLRKKHDAMRKRKYKTQRYKKKKYKRKPGRKKKLGRPKKVIKVPRVIIKKPPFIYKIIWCSNGKQKKFIGRYRTSEEAYEAFNQLKNDKTEVVVPMQVLNVPVEGYKYSVNEYILIKKSDTEENPIMRNEYGKLVEQKLTQDGWVIIDKHSFQREETFWVYGYNPRGDRKDFHWIYNELLLKDLDFYLDFKRVMTYKNKLVIKDDKGEISLITCKCESDSVRLYNALQQHCKKNKVKQVVFVGDFSEKSVMKKQIEQDIATLTGWDMEKIQMRHPTYYCTKK